MENPISTTETAQTEAQRGWGPQALEEMRRARRAYQDSHADGRDRWIRSNRYYYEKLNRLLRFVVEPGRSVLELRCETGEFLAAARPSHGVGVEIGEAMVAHAQRQHPEFQFVRSDLEDLALGKTFDYVVFNHIFDTVDILRSFERIREHCTDQTRLLVINYNHLWEPILGLASRLGLRYPFVEPNWVSEQDVRGFLNLAGFRVIRTHRLFLLPKGVPLFSWLLNDVLGKLPLLRKLCMTQVIVGRPEPVPKREEDVSVSVVVPCRNECGNVSPAIERIPAMGRHTEILFCDDKSTDGTAEEVLRLIELHPERDIKLIAGPGICKAENVWTGFRAATGDILMILDGDLTVMPEELPMFLKALASGRGEFVNGSRLVYPVQRHAMKFANIIGNKLFGLSFSFLLDQRIKDTLCGTKVLWRRDWQRMEPNLGTWGIRDLWGDYELLFGASRLHLEIVEAPVHYQERVYGVSKMTRVVSNGLRMAGICWHAWRRLSG